jgi:predicted dehydrogenase
MQAPAINWGILAPGGIAHRFAREVTQFTKSKIAAVGSRSKERASAFAAEFGIERAYGSYAELVADPGVDAVYISSPHSHHRELAMLALEAGKPVLVEKAFTLNAEQAREVFSLAKSQNLFAMEAMWSRFLPHYSALREIIASGKLGEITGVTATHAQKLNLDPNWRMMDPALGGGALLDLGVYPMSFFHYLLGVPETIHASGSLTDRGVDYNEGFLLRYPSSVLAVGYADMRGPGDCAAQVVGTEGRIEIPDMFYIPNDLYFRASREAEPEKIALKPQGGFQFEAAEVARCLATGLKESPSMSWQDTLEVMEMMDEVRRQLGVEYAADQI